MAQAKRLEEAPKAWSEALAVFSFSLAADNLRSGVKFV